MPDVLEFVILGEACSKANSREIVTRRMRDAQGKLHTRPMVIKSQKARDFERDCLKQIPPRCRVRLTGPVRVVLRMHYCTERPDLDESIVLDCLQDRYAVTDVNGTIRRTLVQAGCYKNDRQVRSKMVDHFIDANNPRIEVRIEAMTMQQSALALKVQADDPLEV